MAWREPMPDAEKPTEAPMPDAEKPTEAQIKRGYDFR